MNDTAIVTPQLEFQFMPEGISAHTIFDRLIQKMDSLVQPGIVDRDATTPPGGETDGDMWLIKATGTGLWAGHDDELAIHYDSFDTSPNLDYQAPWYFIPTYDGMRIWVLDENRFITRKNGTWFAGAAITNPTTTLATMTAALNEIITALEGHGLLDE